MTKKNISLITWLGTGNFGTSLQSYALHKKLELMGYNVHFLSPFEINFGLRSIFLKMIRRVLSFFRMLRDWMLGSESENIRQRKIHKFNRQEYKIKTVHTKKAYKRLLETIDVFVTGSDQIWNTQYDYNPFMFLNFAGNVKRVAYASSIGTNYVPDKYKEKMKELLSKFHSIGVREQSAVDILKDVVGRNDIRQVLDPTFLLSAEEWITFAKDAQIEIKIPKLYILCYLIGRNNSYKEQIEDIKQKTGIKNVIVIPAVENPSFKVIDAIHYDTAGPKEFINLIKMATVVCTDSFHATALSVNLSKDFVEFLRFKDGDNNSQNSRIYDVLSHYGLNERLYHKNSNSWYSTIDYKPVQIILDADRRNSIDYLINAIEN